MNFGFCGQRSIYAADYVRLLHPDAGNLFGIVDCRED